ncbi:MAG: hypothetical protein HUJ97_05625 [Bacteroidales bacterium]|nr:hypothetical protein [Bacteroidales bacterium]MCF0189853.1 hypothetical protein [Marinilabiliaceae bacterium]
MGVVTFAQIPYFSGIVGDGKLYGYTSVKARPGFNAQETYSTFQYGLGDYVAVGMDLYTGVGSSNWGANVRYGHEFNKYFGIGGEVTPSFNLNDSFKYSYTTAAMYMNGAITNDGKLFWCSNTWWGINKDTDNTISNYEYLGYTFGFKNGHSITPMIGAIHSWKFDHDVDIAVGFYYTIKNWNMYLWGNDFFKPHPRVIVGIDFVL